MINRNIVKRLSRYKNVLYRMKRMGLVRIFSENIADATGVSSALVRKDFSILKISGKKKGGYLIGDLIDRADKILGKDVVHKVIVTGAGKIGSALMEYWKHEKGGIRIVAGFDIDPVRQKRESEIPVYPLEELREFVKQNGIKLGIIAVPDIAAQQVFDLMTAAGIKGVLNFAPIRLKTGGNEDCAINYVNFESKLENLIFFMNARKRGMDINEAEK